jgi:DASH complex subunit SPC19
LIARSELLEGRLERKAGLRKQRSLDKLVRKAGTPNWTGVAESQGSGH